MKLANKTAFVTGAASGIGREIALAYAAEGAVVGIADINMDGAEAVAAHINRNSGRAQAFCLDVTVEQDVNACIDDFVERNGKLNILVANAGIQHLDKIGDVSFHDWKRLLAVHLDGSFLCAKAALKHMVAASDGRLLFLGSIHSYMASEKKGPYIVAKHGIVGLCRTIAKEYGRQGIVSNVICPGFVRTPLIEAQLPTLAAERGVTEAQVIEDFLRLTVDGEYTTALELAELAVVLASFPTKLLNGQSIGASHGIHML